MHGGFFPEWQGVEQVTQWQERRSRGARSLRSTGKAPALAGLRLLPPSADMQPLRFHTQTPGRLSGGARHASLRSPTPASSRESIFCAQIRVFLPWPVSSQTGSGMRTRTGRAPMLQPLP